MDKAFDHIIVVMMENQYRSYVMQDRFMRRLAKAGMSLTNSFGCFHPSQTNYVAALAGELCQISNDTAPSYALKQRLLTDQLNEAGVSWRAYMEALPPEPWNPIWAQDSYPAGQAPLASAPNDPAHLARYFRKHNAFASFHNVQKSQAEWAKIGDENAFWRDVENGALPQFSWFSPDIWNDGHYLYNTHLETQPRTHLVPQLSSWLEYVFFGNLVVGELQGAAPSNETHVGLNLDVELLLTDPQAAWAKCRLPPKTLVVVTFDEADYSAIGYDTNYDGPNQIYTVLLGDMITPGTTWDAPFNHYNLLRTVQKNFDLGHLGKNDMGAGWLRALWGQAFGWGAPQDGGWDTGGRLVAGTLQGRACVLTGEGDMALSRLDGDTWTDPQPLPFDTSAPVLATSFAGGLMVTVQGDGFEVWLSPDGCEWNQFAPLYADWRNPCLAGFTDAGGAPRAMLCGQDTQGFIHSAIFDGNGWSAPAPVGQLSDGPMALGQLGPSLILTYKERNTRGMRAVNYNLAPFNAIKALDFQDNRAPQNDTGVHTWAVADFPVGHFAKKFAALKDAYQAHGPLSLAAIEGELHLVHRAAYEDTPQAYDCCFGLTGLLAPVDQRTNGFGSLDQAGWTEQTQLKGVTLPTDGTHGLCTDGDDLILLWRGPNGPLWARGGYARKT
ncbi:alkaline phosphatase family protein [Tropicibacter naphthalenivorans]|uniref:Phospholipase C n=1 Tax=Tropicibacter naphthalenivorans TaxID=441103 RepID=A0A0P1GFZ9_9RHOB|nr:alkaline phosphatase family protein [Tropicibacter naphthalenivorans]CUH80749.1 Phospholipase C [Tropicibacter naphthalenivorans]SMC89958.1 Phosphoesterase family protein [Tropicibacter naphthalenivorans]